MEFFQIPDFATNKTIAVAMFIAGKLKTGEFLKRINKISYGFFYAKAIIMFAALAFFLIIIINVLL